MTSTSLRPIARREPPAERERTRDRALKRFRLAAAGYGVLCLLLVGSALGRLTPVGPVVFIVVVCAVAHTMLYAVLLSGVAEKREEPTCAFAHLLIGMGLLGLAYLLIPAVRSTALQVFFIMVAFDASRLSRRQFAIVSLIAIVGMATSTLGEWTTGSGADSLRTELMNFAMAALYLPVLALIGQVMHGAQLRQRRQKAALTAALAQLQALSERDALTGAINRRHAMVLLEREQLRQQHTHRPFSVCMLDVDFFKQVNDTYGHPVGDQALTTLAQLAQQSVGEPHLVARWGGEEFLVLMFDTTAAEAVRAMERLRRRLAAHDWSVHAIGLRIDASIGVCEHRPGDIFGQTMEHVDRALYAAKQQGRGRVVEHRA